MESITNAASSVTTTASKLLWGENGQQQDATAQNETAGKEPISGETGKGTADEPYDKGNADSTKPTAITPVTETPSSTAMPSQNDSTANVLKDTDIKPLDSKPDPSVGAATATTTNTLDQGGAAPKADTVGDEANVIKDTKEQAEGTQSEKKSGDEIPATKEEQGDVDATKPGAAKEVDSKSAHTTPAGGEKKNHEDGCKVAGAVERISGTLSRADGVAGLAEEKGAKKEFAKETQSTTSTNSPSSEKEKVSKMAKLKEKLHIGHKDKS